MKKILCALLMLFPALAWGQTTYQHAIPGVSGGPVLTAPSNTGGAPGTLGLNTANGLLQLDSSARISGNQTVNLSTGGTQTLNYIGNSIYNSETCSGGTLCGGNGTSFVPLGGNLAGGAFVTTVPSTGGWTIRAYPKQTFTVGTNGVSVTSGSATATITWASCCGTNGPLNGQYSTATSALSVGISGVGTLGGVLVDGTYSIASIVDANDFTITLPSAATSTATGGTGATIIVTRQRSPNQLLTINRDCTSCTVASGNGITVDLQNIQGINEPGVDWGLLAQSTCSGTAGGSCIPGYFQAIRPQLASGLIPSGDMTAALAEVDDYNLLSSGAGAGDTSMADMEWDLRANEQDNAPNPSMVGTYGTRLGLNLVIQHPLPTSDHDANMAEFRTGIWDSCTSETLCSSTQLDSAYSFQSGFPVYNAFDCRGIVLPGTLSGAPAPYGRTSGPPNCVAMSAGDAIDFASGLDGSTGNTLISDAPQRYLEYNSGTSCLDYTDAASSTNLFAACDSGAFSVPSLSVTNPITLPNNSTATTQAFADSSTKVATDAFVATATSGFSAVYTSNGSGTLPSACTEFQVIAVGGGGSGGSGIELTGAGSGGAGGGGGMYGQSGWLPVSTLPTLSFTVVIGAGGAAPAAGAAGNNGAPTTVTFGSVVFTIPGGDGGGVGALGAASAGGGVNSAFFSSGSSSYFHGVASGYGSSATGTASGGNSSNLYGIPGGGGGGGGWNASSVAQAGAGGGRSFYLTGYHGGGSGGAATGANGGSSTITTLPTAWPATAQGDGGGGGGANTSGAGGNGGNGGIPGGGGGGGGSGSTAGGQGGAGGSGAALVECR